MVLFFCLMPFNVDQGVKPLLRLFFDICLLKAKPQDVPVSSALLLLALLLGVVSEVPGIAGSVGGLLPAIIISLLDAVLISVLLYIFLSLMNLSSRFVQTATAMFGIGVIINLLMLPVIRVLDVSPKDSNVMHLGSMLYIALLIWSMVIMGHILRHSFNLRLSSGVLIAVGYFLLINTLVQVFLHAG